MKRLIILFLLGIASIIQAETITLDSETLQEIVQEVEFFKSELESIKSSVQGLQGQEVANYNYNKSEFQRIRLLLGDKFESKTQAEPIARTRVSRNFLMAGKVRDLTSNKLIEETFQRMRDANLNGIHVVVDTDWFSFRAESYDQIKSFDQNNDCFEMLENIRRHCERDGVFLHVWIHGDVQHRLNPIAKFGERSEVEKNLYSRINKTWGGKDWITFGLGFDCEEWIKTDSYAQWIKDQLPDVKIAIRHPEGRFNHIADIPCYMLRRQTKEEINEIADKHTEAEFLLHSDRCRVYRFPTDNDPGKKNGTFTDDEQNEVFLNSNERGASAIYGQFDKEQKRCLKSDPFKRALGWKN